MGRWAGICWETAGGGMTPGAAALAAGRATWNCGKPPNRCAKMFEIMI